MVIRRAEQLIGPEQVNGGQQPAHWVTRDGRPVGWELPQGGAES